MKKKHQPPPAADVFYRRNEFQIFMNKIRIRLSYAKQKNP